MALWSMTDEEAGKPKYLNDADKASTIGVDAAEAATSGAKSKGINTPGWVKYTTYTDAQGNTRNKSEVLVAAGSMATDGTAGIDDDLNPVTATTFTQMVDYSNISFAGMSPVSSAAVDFNGMSPAMITYITGLAVGSPFSATYSIMGTEYTVTGTLATQITDMAGYRGTLNFDTPTMGVSFLTFTA